MRFFAVNWAVAVGWLVIAVASLGTSLHYYGKAWGWRGAESTAVAEVQASGIDAEHYSTTDYGESVRVLFSRRDNGHFVDVDLKRDRNGKWVVTSFNKDFAP